MVCVYCGQSDFKDMFDGVYQCLYCGEFSSEYDDLEKVEKIHRKPKKKQNKDE